MYKHPLYKLNGWLQECLFRCRLQRLKLMWVKRINGVELWPFSMSNMWGNFSNKLPIKDVSKHWAFFSSDQQLKKQPCHSIYSFVCPSIHFFFYQTDSFHSSKPLVTKPDTWHGLVVYNWGSKLRLKLRFWLELLCT